MHFQKKKTNVFKSIFPTLNSKSHTAEMPQLRMFFSENTFNVILCVASEELVFSWTQVCRALKLTTFRLLRQNSHSGSTPPARGSNSTINLHLKLIVAIKGDWPSNLFFRVFDLLWHALVVCLQKTNKQTSYVQFGKTLVESRQVFDLTLLMPITNFPPSGSSSDPSLQTVTWCLTCNLAAVFYTPSAYCAYDVGQLRSQHEERSVPEIKCLWGGFLIFSGSLFQAASRLSNVA